HAFAKSQVRGPMAGPSSAGIRLGPEADRFFSSVGNTARATASAPFDHLGGAVPPSTPPPPGVDPFVARPQPDLPPEPLGKPELRRWLLPVGVVLFGLAVAVAVGAWLGARPKPTTFEIISVPEGASVRVDG